MGLMFQPLRKYATFSGRARRMEYWLFVLFYFVVKICVIGIDRSLGFTLGGGFDVGLAVPVWDLAMLLPSLAVSVRRLHDSGRSGWWLLLIFLPVVGLVVLIVFYCLRGQAGTNRFGADPLLSPA